MTDKEFRVQQARVHSAYRKWHEPTGMGGWIVSHVWHRDGTAGNPDRDRGEYTTAARASVSWEYISVSFHWNLESLACNSDAELDRIVRHEICHVLVNEMRMFGPVAMSAEEADRAMKHEERTVTALASVLLWCFQAGQKAKVARKTKK